MHYWPSGGPLFGCNVNSGMRTSAVDSVTCPDCRANLARSAEAVAVGNPVIFYCGPDGLCSICVEHDGAPEGCGSLFSAQIELRLQRIATVLGESTETVRDLEDAFACCADEGPLEARVDRRQRAREAGLDAAADDGSELDWSDKIDAAVETATRVRIDGETTRAAMIAYAEGTGYDMPSAAGMDHALKAAFRAAGFEVEQ